jgi:glycosyltransferase involved in cell wall biosynthesis
MSQVRRRRFREKELSPVQGWRAMSERVGPFSFGIISLGACALVEPEIKAPVGGSELQLYLLARLLAREGAPEPTLYVADLGQEKRRRDGIRVSLLVKASPGGRLNAGAALTVIARLIRARHDLLITRSASGLNGLVTLAAKLSGKRHVHMCAHDDECRGVADATLSRLARRLHRLAVTRADMLVCQTEAQRGMLQEAFGRAATVCPNLPPPPAAGDRPPAPRKGVLWIGRDVAWKRPEMCVALARELPDVSFTMVCQAQPGRDVDRLRRNAPANLAFHPGLPFRQTASLFARHKVLVSTSASEGFPNTFLQAAAAGTPIVSLVVDPGGMLASGGGMVCGGAFGALVDATRTMLEDLACWQRRRERLRAWAATHARAAEADILAALRRAVR